MAGVQGQWHGGTGARDRAACRRTGVDGPLRAGVSLSNMRRGIILQLLAILALTAFQPDPQTLRRLYEEGLATRERQYGSTDTRTASAARDLGLYLREWGGDPAGAR